jgi:predicted RNA-binding protein with TRAM domain
MSAESNTQSGAPHSNLRTLQEGLAEMRETQARLAAVETDVSDLGLAVEAVLEEVETAPSSDEVEDLQEDVADLRKMVASLTENVCQVEDEIDQQFAALDNRMDQMEERVATLEAVFSNNLLDKQDAHRKAQERDIPFEKGEQYELCIEEVMPGGYDPTLRGRMKNVQTFVEVDDAEPYEAGDVVDIIVTDIDENAVRAIPADET